jgi:hypothetical protein
MHVAQKVMKILGWYNGDSSGSTSTVPRPEP